MVFLGLVFFFRLSAVTNEQMAESSQRVLTQVNLNLDHYLHSMMRISDAAYYRVLKGADLDQDEVSEDLELLYESSQDSLVSIAVFSEKGDLICSAPLAELKNSVIPQQEPWFRRAVEKSENLHFSTPHVQNIFQDPDYHYRWVVSLSRQVPVSSGSPSLGETASFPSGTSWITPGIT